jgi:hypothetical protein
MIKYMQLGFSYVRGNLETSPIKDTNETWITISINIQHYTRDSSQCAYAIEFI